MHIKSSASLRNDYNKISNLAHQTQESIYNTKNGEGDLVVMSIDVFEQRETMLDHRAKILEPEFFSRLAGELIFTVSEDRSRLKAKYKPD